MTPKLGASLPFAPLAAHRVTTLQLRQMSEPDVQGISPPQPSSSKKIAVVLQGAFAYGARGRPISLPRLLVDGSASRRGPGRISGQSPLAHYGSPGL